ncbi:type I pullulanase [Oenococcus kitaharae]|uniref:Glycogen debranching enzyme n=1 Tax=Oenococcus kitaharae DSM 17330 TaxID=1045004 RepID=G9WFA0_9LACO|nr:type I pullulanase [Oenococcus kitaharae]EHN58820.1 Glycogen debranching enzyme [Oenococcus kitaharae DSM 17330]
MTTEVSLFSEIQSEAFDNKFKYKGSDLGAHYTATGTSFKLWAPTALKVDLIVYGNAKQPMLDGTVYHMQRGSDKQRGIFILYLAGDHDKMIYNFRLSFKNGRITESRDPYAFAVTVNGDRSVVIDQSKSYPADFHSSRFKRVDQAVDALIYELHIRDFTTSPSSGIDQQFRGKYLGAVQTGSTNPASSKATGIDYLKQIGINYVQIQPFFDFATVDENNPSSKYNWGYDPKNYNVPEGSYASNPNDPYCRLIETKEMIQGFHDQGIGVIMDVVYNHVFLVDQSSLDATVPGYYFRHNPDGSLSNGSGINNDTASERAMFQKFMIDSVCYWVKNFGVDGFRFDLMGIHDVDTMTKIRHAMDEIDPKILLYGEGWNMNTALPEKLRATQQNADVLPGIAFFSDQMRDAVKGDGDSQKGGFVNGPYQLSANQQLKASILGHASNGSYQNAAQLIQYVEVHDNLTLNDKLSLTNPQDDPYHHYLRDTLATAIIYLSEGIPLIAAGQEFLRSKHGNANSYNAPDIVNALDWGQLSKQHKSIEFLTQLINFRKSTTQLHLTRYDDIDRQVKFWDSGTKSLIVYTLDHDFLIALNASGQKIDLKTKISYVNFNQAKLLLTNDYQENGSKAEINDLTIQVWKL